MLDVLAELSLGRVARGVEMGTFPLPRLDGGGVG